MELVLDLDGNHPHAMLDSQQIRCMRLRLQFIGRSFLPGKLMSLVPR